MTPGRSSSNGTGASTASLPRIPDHELLRCIGRGSYGEVWLARNVMGLHRAVKVVRRASFDKARPYDREFEGICKFEPVSRSHEGLVDILQVGRNDADGYFYYVMELADDAARQLSEVTGERSAGSHEGEPIDSGSYVPKTLSSELSRHGRLSADECVKIGLSLSIALEHLHQQGLVHRDIKPANIIFVNGTLKLADIGLVTEAGEQRSLVGTEGFIPPEGAGTPQADIYSLGKVLYELSTGKDRQEFPNPMTQLGELPDREALLELTEVVARACAGNPRQRYASSTELRADLALLLGGKSVRRLRKLEQTWRRLRIMLPIAGVVLAAIGAARLQVTRTRDAAQRRHDLLERAFIIRTQQRQAGWFTNAWQRLRSATDIAFDRSTREQAAATLIGLDARVVAEELMPSLHVAFGAMERTLFIDGETNGLRAWNTATTNFAACPTSGHGPVGFLTNGNPVQLARRADGSFALGNAETGETVSAFALDGFTGTNGQVITRDAARAAAVFGNGQTNRIVVWHPVTGQQVRPLPGGATALALTADGSLLAAGHEDGRIVVWSIVDGREVVTFQENRAQIECLRFHQERRTDAEGRTGRWLLAAGDNGGTLVVWDLAAKSLRSRFRGSEYDVAAVAFSPDGMTLASAGRSDVRLWDIATERLLLQFMEYDQTTDLAFSRDGRRLAVCSRGGSRTARTALLELDSARGGQGLRGLLGMVGKCCFSADGRLVAAVSHNWQVGIWDLQTGHLLRVIEAPKGLVADNSTLAFDADGRHFAFSTAREAGLWEVASGRRVGRWTLPPGLVDVLAFTASGRLLLGRMETRDARAEPWNSSHPREHPRVCRIRELKIPNTLSPIGSDIETFNWRVDDGFVTPDGACFVFNGKHVAGTITNWSIRGYDGLSGKERWALPVTNRSPIKPEMDPSGKMFSTILDVSETGHWFELPSGRPIPGDRFQPAALGVGGALCLRRQEPRGYTLMNQGGTNALVSLGIDFPRSATFPVFSRDGTKVAWGTAEGMLLVWEIEPVRQRLTELGLSW